jgi:sugar O-acyltransferase (sialic acid O-acetyltransferase NeuD family)
VPIAIVGAGDHARVVLEGLRASGRTAVGFVEPTGPDAAGRTVDGLPVLGTLDEPSWMATSGADAFIVAIGDNGVRRAAFERCRELGLRAEPMVHPSATVLGGADVGPGSQVCAGAVIGLAARLGVDVIVNTLASVDHDCGIGDHAFVAPGARLAGRVVVGEGAWIGIGAVVREGIGIGAWARVAAGAVVVRDVEAHHRVAGVPARPMNDLAGVTEDA